MNDTPLDATSPDEQRALPTACAANPHATRIIAVVSGKGGVGKTSIAVNLGFALAGFGKRVALLDADLGLSNVDVLLGTSPTVTLEHVLFDDVPMEKALYAVTPNLDVISGCSGVSRMAELSREKRIALLREFQKLRSYDYLIVDNSPGISTQVVSICLSCNEILIILNPDPSSLVDAYALLKVLKQNGLYRSPLLLINRISSIKRAKAIADRIRATTRKHLALDCRFIGSIPEDAALYRAAMNRRPLMEIEPQSLAAQACADIALRLDAMQQGNVGTTLLPERFFDQSVMRVQQGPSLSHGRASETPHAGPPDRQEWLDGLESLFREVGTCLKALEEYDAETARNLSDRINALRPRLTEGTTAQETASGETTPPEHDASTPVPPQHTPEERTPSLLIQEIKGKKMVLFCENSVWRDLLWQLFTEMGLVPIDPQDWLSNTTGSVELAVLYTETFLPETISILRSLGETPVLCILPEKRIAEEIAHKMPPNAQRIILHYPVELDDVAGAVRRLLL